MVLVGAAVYGVSLWTYTLLPLPDEGDYTCQHAQTQLMAFADDIRRASRAGRVRRPRHAQRAAGRGQPGVPPGRAERRAVPAVRGVRPADHPPRRGGGDGARLRRVTADRGHPAHGRLGRLPLRLPALRRRRPADQHAGRLPRRASSPTRTPPADAAGSARRVAGCRPRCRWAAAWRATLSDVLFVVLAGTAAAALWRGYLVFAAGPAPADRLASMIALRAGVPLVAQALMVLLAGKTVGELVVDLRTSPASYPRRLVKLLVGVVPLVTLAVVTVPAAQVAVAVLARRRSRRRLPHPGPPRPQQRRRPAGAGDRRLTFIAGRGGPSGPSRDPGTRSAAFSPGFETGARLRAFLNQRAGVPLSVVRGTMAGTGRLRLQRGRTTFVRHERHGSGVASHAHRPQHRQQQARPGHGPAGAVVRAPAPPPDRGLPGADGRRRLPRRRHARCWCSGSSTTASSPRTPRWSSSWPA